MDRYQFEWHDEDDWKGLVEIAGRKRLRITLWEPAENATTAISHVIANAEAMAIAFHTMCLASPALPSAGEFWIVEADGVRRVVQVQDNPTFETIGGEVRFIARIPVEAQ